MTLKFVFGSSLNMADVVDIDFPVSGLLPKKETGVTAFINKYPEYDGRGCVIAILDSGVDPGAAGLQITSDGKPKIIGRFDCSGAGDIDTSTIVEAKEGVITGLTGRKLKVPSTWVNPTGAYRIGVKIASDLYPPKVKERVEADRKERIWDPQHKEALARATRELQEYEAKIAQVTQLSQNEKLQKEELEARVEMLNNMEKKYSDPGCVYDCILFHDGEIWRACIDTSEQGDLESGVLLGEYSKTLEFLPMTKIDQLSISINVHDNGDTLEIVGMCSSHGTHVSSIAAAYFPDDPDRCGIAPGAQIISLTIGDGRLGSMETGHSIVRAMIKIMELCREEQGVHIINMSYGEHAHFSNTGRIGELMNEVVNKYGVVWVASAGNHGPALCTIGTPPDISEPSIISVGAYVTPEMMVAEYSLRSKLPGMPYTWTSRGPTIDGDIGVTVCAPGGAITSVPAFTLSQAQLMNGTSMSAPHVSGALGIILSGVIQKQLPYSPYSVKRALENSAKFLDACDRFAQGYGLLQVEKAFDHLVTYHDSVERDVRFIVSCSQGKKGIHLRNGVQDKCKDILVSIEPIFRNEKDTEASSKIKFGMRLVLICKDSWISCGKYLDLCHTVRALTVRVDGSQLKVGVHNSAIKAYDTACIEKGHVFCINVTIVQPHIFPSSAPSYQLTWPDQFFPANTLKRHFVLVPELATYAVLKLRSKSEVKGRFIIHCMQLRPQQSCKTLELHKMIHLNPDGDNIISFPVKAGLILEVVIAKYWAHSDDLSLNYSLEFHGISPDNTNLVMYGADGLYPIELRSLQTEDMVPSIALKTIVQAVRPNPDCKVAPLSSRIMIPPGRQIYELILTYNFHIYKNLDISPNFPLLSDQLYESEFESQMWMLYDCNKQLLATGDAYPSKYNVKLDKGDYVLRLSIRHDKKELLDKLVDSPILISHKLATPISLDIYPSQSQAITCGKKLISLQMVPFSTKVLYVAPPSHEKVTKNLPVGQYLVGCASFTKDESGKKVDSYTFKYVLPEAPKKNGSKQEKEKDKTKWDEYCDAIRDTKTTWLSKLDAGDEANKLYADLCSTHPEHLMIHAAMLQSLEPVEPKRLLPILFANKADNIGELCSLSKHILEVTSLILKGIDQEKLLAYYGMKTDTRTDAAKVKLTMDKNKNLLLEALCKRGIALCRLYLFQQDLDGDGDSKDGIREQITALWDDVLKFTEPTDMKVIYFSLWFAAMHKHYGRMLKLLGKLLEEKPIKEIEEKMSEVHSELLWNHSAQHVSRSCANKYPNAYKLF